MNEQPQAASTDPPRSEQRPSPLHNRQLQVGVLVLLAVAIGIIAWAWAGKGSDSAPSSGEATPTVEQTGPVLLSEKGLKTLAAEIPEPIYWMGPKPNTRYELTRLSDGKIYVRYLPPGVPVDGRQGELTVIATYAFDDAFEALTATEGEQFTIPGSGVAVVDTRTPTSIHLAFPGSAYQVEVYDPDPERARAIALSGALAPVK
ncbi:MAG TPA: hypothetical protein VFR32_04180 [Gaiellaceae bacterium]|nr:hypothetical protein [Gaiellaceae bacterium]